MTTYFFKYFITTLIAISTTNNTVLKTWRGDLCLKFPVKIFENYFNMDISFEMNNLIKIVHMIKKNKDLLV